MILFDLRVVNLQNFVCGALRVLRCGPLLDAAFLMCNYQDVEVLQMSIRPGVKVTVTSEVTVSLSPEI
jgi:hypothetical protein